MFRELAKLEPESPEFRRHRDRIVERCLPLADHIARRFDGGQISDVQLYKSGSRIIIEKGDPRYTQMYESGLIDEVMSQVADPVYRRIANGGLLPDDRPALDDIAGVCNETRNVFGMMPHPERVFRTLQMSWHPAQWGEDSPWLRLFRNARAFVA
jgi:hypothetical protein